MSGRNAYQWHGTARTDRRLLETGGSRARRRTPDHGCPPFRLVDGPRPGAIASLGKLTGSSARLHFWGRALLRLNAKRECLVEGSVLGQRPAI